MGPSDGRRRQWSARHLFRLSTRSGDTRYLDAPRLERLPAMDGLAHLWRRWRPAPTALSGPASLDRVVSRWLPEVLPRTPCFPRQ
jgi:hypothetical protein